MYRQKFRNYTKVKGNKYNASKTTYNDITYHSAKEAAYAQELDLRIRAKNIKSWKRQVKLSLDVNNVHICNYFIDFVITHNDDSIEYVEIKGYVTEVWRLKWKIFEAIWNEKEPEAKLTVIY